VTDSVLESDPTAGLGNRARIMRVLRNPRVRRLQLAFLGSTLGDWAYATAIVVWAYEDGGAKAVGAYQAVRFLAMAVFAPIGGVLADRMSRRAFMIIADLVRALLVAGAGLIVVADGPALVVYVLAIVAALVGSPFRAAAAGLMTDLVDSPTELTTSNALSANVESVMLFAGPALAGVIIGVSGVEEVFWLNAATFVWSIGMLLGVRAEPAAGASEGSPLPEPDDASAAESPGFWTELTSGFGLIGRDRDLRSVALLSGGVGLAWGALSVFMVLLATDVLDAGPKGLGYLNSVLGVATVASGVLILTRLSSSRLGQDMVVGVAVGWGVPLLAMAAFPSTVTTVLAVAAIGLFEGLGSLGMETIPQRLAPSHMISRVYAAIESSLVGPMALGALLAPALVHWVGLRGALAIAGALPLLIGLSRWPGMRALDRRLAAPAELELLRTVTVFADMPAPALERLAHAAEHVQVAAGDIVVAEGGTSDRFYVIVTGEVEVTQRGRVLRTEGPGDFFGEIGLLRNVLRTATVTATSDSEFLVVEQADFLAAVNHMGESISALDDVIVRRLYA
jgi:MFS family permease